MKSILINLILFSTLSLLHAQNAEGKVTYGVAIIEQLFDENKKNKNNTNKMISSFIEESKNIEFSLLFNNYQSFYSIDKKLEVKDLKTKMAQIYFGGNNAFYLNKKEKKNFSFVNAYGSFFRVKQDPYVWQITKETKKIGNYLCYKATTIKIVENQKGKFKKEVVAWYSKDIPLSYGPRNYNGLPGLILEVQEGKQSIYAKKINLKLIENIKITEPKRGKLMSQKEFIEMGNKITH